MKKLMKISVITFYLLLFTSIAFGQIKFNVSDSLYYGPNQRNVVIQEDNYYSLGGASINDILGVTPCKYDLNGNLLETKYYADTIDWFHGIENSLRETKSGNYILGASRGLDYFRDNMLIKFDRSFDTIFTKRYYPVNDNGDSDALTFNANIDTDGNYLMVGASNIDNDYNIYLKYQMQLIKTDTMGNLLWRKTYGDTINTYEAYKITPTFNGGYLLGGWCDKNGGDWAIVKTDENGENPIFKNFGHPTNGDGRLGGITPTKDSCYLIAGNYAIAPNGVDKARIMKVDRDLNIIWDKQYLNVGVVSLFFEAFEKTNGNIIVYGSEDNSNSRSMLAIMELTSEGDSLWKQTTTCLDTIKSHNYMENAKLTPDGGIIFGGWTTNVYQFPFQQMALIKTDSMGCDGTQWTSCGSVDIIEPIAQNNTEAGLRVYPNPTNKNLTLTLSKREGTLAEQLINVGALQEQKGAFNKRSYSTNKQKLSDLPTNVSPSLLERVWGEASIREKLKYNIKHPEQKLWGKAEEKEMLELSRKHAIMFPFDVLRGETDIFAIEPTLGNLQFTMYNEQKNNAKNQKTELENLSTLKLDKLITIYDIYGRLVKSVNRTFQFDEEITINVSDLNRGIYLLRVGGESVKFVKE